jgi:lysozyme
MRKILGGNRPDITPAQIIAGIPVIATLLNVFGRSRLRAGATRADAAGLAFISREEGTVLHPYNDSQGYATVFVGHLIAYRHVIARDWTDWAPLDRPHAIRVLAKDVKEVEDAIHASVHVSLNQNEFNALCSLGFNIGTGGLRSSTVVRRLNAGDRRGAADAFLMWRIPSVLLPRRYRERALFLKPAPKPAPTEDLSVLRDDERKWVREYDGIQVDSARKRRLRRAMAERRKLLYALAQPKPKGDGHGWRKWHRLERYRILRSRTR